jgi:hypothetical protein
MIMIRCRIERNMEFLLGTGFLIRAVEQRSCSMTGATRLMFIDGYFLEAGIDHRTGLRACLGSGFGN